MSAPAVGILALQGAVEAHARVLADLGREAREVRAPEDLDGLAHLILPGGESTTLHRLMTLFGLWDEVAQLAGRGELALLGTCAGAILLGHGADERPPTLGLLDAVVVRNAYGRQLDSRVRPLTFTDGGPPGEGVFIRAPRFTRVGPGVRVLARAGTEPVALEAPGVLATTFHPELAGDARFHARLLDLRGTQRAAPARPA